MNKNILYLILFSLLASCNQNAGNGESINIDNNYVGDDLINISQIQFETGKMVKGSLIDTIFTKTINVSGVIDIPSTGHADVSVYFGGFVKNINLYPNEFVKKGQVLFSLENPDFIKTQQEYLEAKSRLQYLKEEYERYKELQDDQAVAKKTLLKAESEYNIERTKYESTSKILKMMGINSSSLTENSLVTSIKIFAPISGYIEKLNVANGTFINSTDIALSIISTDHLHLELNVFESDIQLLRPEMPIKFSVAQNRDKTYDATIHLIGKSIDPDTRSVNVHGHLLNETNIDLSPGMYAEASIIVDQRKVKALPENAIVSLDEGDFILVQDKMENGEIYFKKMKVKLGEHQNGFIEIKNFEEFDQNTVVLIKGSFSLLME